MLMRQLLVHTEHIGCFATTHADVAGRHVNVRAYVMPQFQHESLTETHNLRIALAARRKIGTAFGSAHRECRQSILKSLFKAQEFQNGKSDGRVKANPALVRPDGIIELHTIADVYLHIAPVVRPRDTESNDAVRLNQPLHYFSLFKFGMLIVNVFNGYEDFPHRLQVFPFSRMLGFQGSHNCLRLHGASIFN
ncbi:hypothetical protein Barb7_02441 [Bacteroidales bacterium Barb7]|nr:hypothetical protein Barb7_02441 [Bacteroidales bacterium Barb7]